MISLNVFKATFFCGVGDQNQGFTHVRQVIFQYYSKVTAYTDDWGTSGSQPGQNAHLQVFW